MEPDISIPRIVVAATGSGVGKTTVTVALLGTLARRGLKVVAFKCGPDYLDPTYHARVTGQPSQNLDAWMMGREAVLATFVRGAAGADLALIEGMMGLFDGATPTGDEGSTAEIAKWLGAPVLLVLDASGIARTVGAVATGFRRYDPALNVAGLICNRVGGRGHLDLLRDAKPEVPIVGGLPADSGLAFPERHLGLLAADEASVSRQTLESWSQLAADYCDLDAIFEIAKSASSLSLQPANAAPARPSSRRCRIGVAFDEAFHFYYRDNLARLESLGAEIVRFSPTLDSRLPDTDGLYFGGGYPEAKARELSSNRAMIEAVRRFAGRGGPIYAECGGLMYLSEGIRTIDGNLWPMVGLIAGETVMADRLQALGYVEVTTRDDSILGPAGMRFRGHQFRYSTLHSGPNRQVPLVYSVVPRWGGASFAEGYSVGSVLASYVHAHWASNPLLAEGLVASCARFRLREGRDHALDG